MLSVSPLQMPQWKSNDTDQTLAWGGGTGHMTPTRPVRLTRLSGSQTLSSAATTDKLQPGGSFYQLESELQHVATSVLM